jgi:magnesium transporter
VSLIKYLAREWGIGATIALILGSLTFGASFLWLGDVLLSAVLAFSIIVTVMFSITVTVLLPWIFQKLNYDPAIASGPLATVICDLSSVTIYLLIATALL